VSKGETVKLSDIQFVEPPVSKTTGRGRTSDKWQFVLLLAAQAPNEWAKYPEPVNTASMFYEIRKEIPNLQIASRKNPTDRKKIDVYCRIVTA